MTDHKDIINSFLRDTAVVKHIGSFAGEDYGGSFDYYEVKSSSGSVRTVCLFRTPLDINNPLDDAGDFSPVDGVVTGLGYGVVGCYSSEGKLIHRIEDKEQLHHGGSLMHRDKYSTYFLYLLAA
jgi:hypothetical protein